LNKLLDELWLGELTGPFAIGEETFVLAAIVPILVCMGINIMCTEDRRQSPQVWSLELVATYVKFKGSRISGNDLAGRVTLA